MYAINNDYYRGAITINTTISGSGVVQGYCWCLSSTSTTITIEIAEDQAIDSVDTAMKLFRENKLTYFPAVTCSCSDL